MSQLSLPLGHTVEGNKLVTLDGISFIQHKHIIGISGSGKSSFIASIAVFLLRLGVSFCLIDPHGDLAKLILSLLASSDFYNNPRAYDRLWYVDFNREDRAAIAWNVLKQDHIDNYKVASNLVEAVHRAFPTSSNATTALDNTIEYSAFVLAECGVPLTQLQRFLLDASFRDSLLAKIKDQQIVQFFDFKFAEKVSSQLIDSTMRRLDLLTFSPGLRAALGQRQNKLNFRKLMDTHTSCIINLGGLSDAEKRLAGCLLMVGLEQAFLSRATIPPENRTPYHVIVDEFPLFTVSDNSFSVILEQVRKYGGTLYLAHQTTSQLGKGMTGSLQNAISILFKLGYEDSTWAAQRFVRKQDEQGSSLIDWVMRGGQSQESSPFDETKNTQEARQIFENLERAHAIVNINNQALHIRTLTIPRVNVAPRRLAEIEDTYAAKLLTPLSRIERDQTAASLVSLSSVAVSLAKRRVLCSVVAGEPLQFITGSLSDDLLTSLFHLHYATLIQLCKLLDRESSINHVRSKLNNMKADGMVDSTTFPVTSGKPPTIWFLTQGALKDIADSLGLPVPLSSGEKKHGYLQHTLACSDLAVASITLPQVNKSFTLMNFKHERTLKNAAIKISEGVYLVPDGWVHLRLNNAEDIGICFEIDRDTEEKEKIVAKINNYVAFARGIYQRTFGLSSLSIAFVVTDGGHKRVKQLLSWAEQALDANLGAASLFLFGSVSPGALEPDSFFLDSTFLSPFDTTPYALVDTP